MKQYKLQELVGNTKKLPYAEKLFFETLINFRKLPECAQLFLPLQLQAHLKTRSRQSSSLSSGKQDTNKSNDMKRQCSREDEEVQSYAEWKVFVSWLKLSSWKHFRRFRKSVVYILPIGPFPDGLLSALVSPQLTFAQALVNFGEAFFLGLSFQILPEIEYDEIGCKTRLHKKTGQIQLFLPDVMQYLSAVAPKNSIGIIGLSWIDFYPGDEWNHILGEGSVHSGCAAISFGHYSKFASGEIQSSISSRGHNTPSTTQSFTSERSEAGLKVSRDLVDDNLIPTAFQEKKYPTSLLNEPHRRKASSSLSLNVKRMSVASNVSLNGPLSRSSSSYKHLGSLSSIENSWTKVFSRSVNSLCSGLSVDDASYDIINKEEAETYLAGHGMEEDIIKLALPLGTSFDLSCATMWRLFKAISHEICHVFGLSHCCFYECAMNSSRLVSEVDEQPFFLCPICLRKLQKFLKFKLIERYWKLQDVLNAMQPCYVEHISVYRDDYFHEIGDDVIQDFTSQNEARDIISDSHAEGCGRFDEPAGHICIEVTREKTDGYDIINVEYKQKNAFEQGAYGDHDCNFSEALEKLDGIISFLNQN